ncbi:hypothetical protein [Rubrivivax gelatinosus]|uniref:hypothetical protein n=1 Tax=Rubrivivax gelatinosus TaxID=28068 RepID=UPI001906F6D0|nr:hypothetical protein [Rubrivivax gelatinosus]
MRTASNPFKVVVHQPDGSVDRLDVMADSSADAIVQVMDLHPEARRISAHLQAPEPKPLAAAAAPAKRPCAELGMCQGDRRCPGCTQDGPVLAWLGDAALELRMRSRRAIAFFRRRSAGRS